MSRQELDEAVRVILEQEPREMFRILFQVPPATRIPVDRKSLK